MQPLQQRLGLSLQGTLRPALEAGGQGLVLSRPGSRPLLYGGLGGSLYFVPFNLQQVQG